MAATYKAPIPDDQVQPIAEYLVAAKENGPGFRMTSVAAIPERFDEAVNLTIDTNDRAAVTHGEQLYGTHCASCHGAGGRGDGVAARGLLPPPTDFTAARFSSKLLYQTIHQGVPATAMPAYGNLSDKDTASIVSYLQTLAPAALTNSGSNEDARTLYAQNCASCHGATGHADGVASAPLPRPPANFGMKQPTAEAAYRAITDGVPGTAMTAWKSKLTEPQRQALAEYVRTFGSSAGK
jgi:cbb3-type cytochrome c oxidase subunit III